MSGRPKEFVDEIVLDKAIELFWKQGYEATSLDQLLAVMGIGKGSMYHNFGNKREVFTLALNRFMQNVLVSFESEISRSKDPIGVIRDFFRKIVRQGPEEHRRGCFLGNTVAELASIDPGLEKLAIEHLEKLEDTFYKHIKSGQKEGRLKTKEDPRLLARHLINVWNGLNITRRMYSSAKDLHSLVELQLKPLA